MKFAVAFRGQPRDYELGFKFFKEQIISTYDVDFFGHVWWDKDKIGEKYNTSKFAEYFNYVIEEDIPTKLKKLYNFKKLKVESPRIFDYEIETGQRLLSQYYSLQQGIKLIEEYEKENNCVYDLIILTRWDIYTNISLNFDLNTLDIHQIHTCFVDKNSKLFYDPIIICGGEHKDVFKTLYDDFDIAVKESGNIVNGEQIMSSYVNLKKPFCVVNNEIFRDFLIELMKKRKFKI